MYGLSIETVNLNSTEKLEVERFLSTFNLSLDKNIEFTFAAKIKNEIIGTYSIAGKVIKCFAVSSEFQGQGLGAELVTHAHNFLIDRGIFGSFVFTKSKNRGIFTDLGYREVFSVEKVSLMEGGRANIKRSINEMFIRSGLDSREKAALVMNCNPFTLGHRYLIEKASFENEQVVVFIVQENLSEFPFEDRIGLVQKGVADLKNVTVIPGEDYIISSATFPSYFLKEEDEWLEVYTSLDSGIFGKYIVSVFNIKKRYVGTEPYCIVTDAYNAALRQNMPHHGVELVVTERLNGDRKPISASRVRRLIKQDRWEEIRNLVPEETFNYLNQKRRG